MENSLVLVQWLSLTRSLFFLPFSYVIFYVCVCCNCGLKGPGRCRQVFLLAIGSLALGVKSRKLAKDAESNPLPPPPYSLTPHPFVLMVVCKLHLLSIIHPSFSLFLAKSICSGVPCSLPLFLFFSVHCDQLFFFVTFVSLNCNSSWGI